MTKRYLLQFIAFWIMVPSMPAMAQQHYRHVLESLQQNPSYELLHRQKDLRHAEVDATPLLDDPQLSFEFLHASRTGESNRWSVSLSQPVPLPTRYHRMRRLRRLEKDTVELHWLLRRQQWLLEAQRLCADIVYANALLAHHTHCADMAAQVVEAMSRRMDLGDCNIIQYNRARLELAAMQNKQARLQTLRESRLQELGILNGNHPVVLADTCFPPVALPDDFESWYRQVQSHAPELRLAAAHTSFHEANLALAKSRSLPLIQAGVGAEYEAECLFRGVVLGVNVPIWNRRKQVRSARIEWQTSRYGEQQAGADHYGRLRMLFNRVKALQAEISRLSELYSRHDSEALLLKAFLVGEISLEAYLQSVEFFHDASLSILDARYELECTWLELMAVTL